MENIEITLPHYWRILKKRRWIAIYTYIVVLLSTFFFTNIQKPVYQSAIEIRVEKKVDEPDFNNFWGVSNAPSLATEIQVIKSLPIIEKTVEWVEVLPTEIEEREQVIHSLARSYHDQIKISQIEDTNIIKIITHSDNPNKAAMFANALADVYIQEHIEGKRRHARAIFDFTEKQLLDLKKKIKKGEKELQKFEQNERVFVVTPKIKNTLDRMTVERTFEFEKEMLNLRQRLEKLDAIIKDKEKSGKLSFLSGFDISEDYIFTGLRRRLSVLEFERILLLIDYTDDHPSVVQQDNVIQDIKNKIVRMIKQYSNIPLSSEIQEDLSLVISQLFMETKAEVLYRIVNKYYGDSGSLSPDQLRYSEIKRNVDRNLEAYNRALDQKGGSELAIASELATISVVTPAFIPKHPIKPVKSLNYLVGSLIGIILGMTMVFMTENMDTTAATMEDVERLLQLPIMGTIPQIKIKGKNIQDSKYRKSQEFQLQMLRENLVTVFYPHSQETESFKTLRTNIINKLKQEKKKVFLVTSSEPREGKSTVSTNIAMSMAQLGKKTLLVGANLRRPSVYNIFGIKREPGLTDILMERINWQEAVKTPTDILFGDLDVETLLSIPGIDNLSIITSGHIIPNPSEILDSKNMDQFLKLMRDQFDIIILDCPPILPVPEAAVLSGKVDGVIIVYKVGITNKEILKRAVAQMVNVNANIWGVVLNHIKANSQMGSSANYNRYYGYSEKRKMNLTEKLITYFRS